MTAMISPILLVLILSIEDPPPGLAKPELRSRASAAIEQGDYRGAADLLFQEAQQHPGRLRSSLALRGHCFALAGDPWTALAVFQQAVEVGFRDVRYLSTDSKLSALFEDARWKKVVARAEANEAAHAASLNPRLRRFYEWDQRPLPPGPKPLTRAEWGRQMRALRAFEARRRRIVARMIARGEVRTADDHYHAAMLFHHGQGLADFRRARALALEAVRLNPNDESALWLAASARDRELLHLGKPQRYGTHQSRAADGTRGLRPVDPTVTDEERRRWNVTSLPGIKANLALENQRIRAETAAAASASEGGRVSGAADRR